MEQESDTIRGTVVNSLTHEPVGRALVFSPDNRYAVMTDDRGRFEFKFPRPDEHPAFNLKGPERQGIVGFAGQSPNANRPSTLMARKPGFLPQSDRLTIQLGATPQELTLPLVPEALIVGHVRIPGSAGFDRIQVELYRRGVREGVERWDPAGSISSRSDGEFRFAELQAGSYKLVSRELLDNDPLSINSRGQLFGYPPAYYPAATDFAAASVIQLSAGATFEANISPTRREYYPVKVAVANATPDLSLGVQVWPQAHAGPGYSLGYNAQEQLIQGSLPDGSYVLELTAYGPHAMAGMSNLTVRGAPVVGQSVMLLPNSSIPVTVREEFQHQENVAPSTNSVDGLGLAARIPKPSTYLQVNLMPLDTFNRVPSASLRPPKGPDDDLPLMIENTFPGRYRVEVQTAIGYASSIASGGADLLRQPLLVPFGSAVPPIEITLRDDGAEVDGSLESTSGNSPSRTGLNALGQPRGYVCFLPVPDSGGQFRFTWISPDGSFQLRQLPPGVYRVFAFDRQQPDLEYQSEEALSKYDSRARLLRVVAGQKEHLQVPLIASSE